MQYSFVFLILSTLLIGCDRVETKLDIIDLKKTSLRYFITINYSLLSNEMKYGEDEYLNSLYSEIASFKTTITKSAVKEKFSSIKDPFDFAVSITKDID